MLLLNILNILNLVSVHISLKSDRREYQKDSYRSKEVTNVRRYMHKNSDRLETISTNAISYSGQDENEKMTQNVKTDINSFYTDTGQIKDKRNGERDGDVNIYLKQNVNINVIYDTDTDWYDVIPINIYKLDKISNANTDKNLKDNSVRTKNNILVQNNIAVNNLNAGHNVIENLVDGNSNKKAVLSVEQTPTLNQYIERISNQDIDKNINSNVEIANFNHNKHTGGIDINQHVAELFNDALNSNYGRNIKKYLYEDVTDNESVTPSSNEKQGDFDDTEYESKSHEEQDSYEISAEFSDKKNLENSDSQIFDKELKQLELEDFKHDLVVEEEIDRPVTPKIKFEKKDDETITMKIEWGPLIRQERTVSKAFIRKGRRKPTAWEKYFCNYHDNIGIPSAEKLRAHELSDSTSRLRASTRIVNGVGAELGDFPYLGGLIIKLENGRVSVCGSTLLTNYHVVTAAHCGMDNNHIATNVTIVFASTKIFKGGTRRNVTSILLHPNYQVKFIQNDVALMSMKYTQYDGKWINRIVLPAGTLMKEKFVGVKLRAAGYGRTSDSESEKGKQTLRTVDIKILNTSDCLKVYGKKVVTNKTLCGDGTFGGTCFGDSGGPLVLIRPGGKHVLVGITSFGSGKGCEKKIPLGYSRVSYFKPWIMKEIKTHSNETLNRFRLRDKKTKRKKKKN